ncbi:DNA sulfur modification protein DndB [Shewanella baltica]|uniref:DNA sulfur modification protein DndB n=1 Tax=Shewanella baltica TaxID=62322 RepID=UPI000DFDE959|nr:DNA sulfur modification protein DndB [Shewanella baltica]SUI57621.1 DGQHR domain [Shewanella baltica]
MRRTNIDKYKYNFERVGSFGVFRSNGSAPVEFIMSTMSIDEIANLSFARDISSGLNFDYLIQRDIDQDRALSEISRYITSTEGDIQKEVVFLPPLLVAVVETDTENNLVNYYPDSNFDENQDEYGETYLREWPGLFKVTNFGSKSGVDISFVTVEHGISDKKIDIGQAKIEVYLTKKKVRGGKLVVIDGQHRLYALEHLRAHSYSKVKDIVVPVCIIYAANSCHGLNNDADIQPSIPSFMRSLFVDVNSTVERVSGHFLTLLQDNTLGSIICRDFCNELLKDPELGVNALALVEWNTKNHKESLTITREHTLTSIGVLNSGFEESFKSDSGIKLISDVIGLRDNINEFSFGLDEYNQENVMPKDFPWRDFSLQHKEKLTKLVNSSITIFLKRVFFGVKHYEIAFNYFTIDLDRFINKVIENRDPHCESAEVVKCHLLFNDPISGDDKSAKSLLARFLDEYKQHRDEILPEIARKTIYQKAIIESWCKLLELLIPRGIPVDTVSEVLCKLVESSLDDNAAILNVNNPHIQGTVFDGSRIKVTKESKKQISRLILLKLLDLKFTRYFNFTDVIENALVNFGVKEFSLYYGRMIKDKKSNFIKTYKSNFSLSSYDREILLAAEEKRDQDLKVAKSSASKIEASKEFDTLVMGILNTEFELADKSLSSYLGEDNSWIVYTLNGFEDE